MEITTEIHNGTPYYIFVSRGTRYTVRDTRDTDLWYDFEVYSNRLAYGDGRINPPTVYRSLEELGKRSKALFNFTKLLEA